MAEELKLTAEYKGYTISWESWGKEWHVELQGQLEKRGFTSPDKAMEWIDVHIKKIFKRVDILRKEGFSLPKFIRGVATSIDEDGKQVWISTGDKRGKYSIALIFLASPENQALITQLGGLVKERQLLAEQQQQLEDSLARLTPEMMVGT